MRLGTALSGNQSVPVVQRGDALHALGVPPGTTLAALLADGPDAVRAAVADCGPPLAEARLTAPLRPSKVIAVGLNYLDHIREADAARPEWPLIFAKLPSSVIGPDEPIVIDRALTQRVDWEVELAVVIGRRLRAVDPAEAMSGIAGYTVANDVSARDLQFADGQWIRGKSLDTFCPLGPLMVTPDEIGDPQRLPLRTLVNGECVQDSTTAEMLFGIGELLAFCAAAFTLEPADVILTGTPWGCGEFMTPQRSLQGGDTVEVSVTGVGTLRNPVVERSPSTLPVWQSP